LGEVTPVVRLRRFLRSIEITSVIAALNSLDLRDEAANAIERYGIESRTMAPWAL